MEVEGGETKKQKKQRERIEENVGKAITPVKFSPHARQARWSISAQHHPSARPVKHAFKTQPTASFRKRKQARATHVPTSLNFFPQIIRSLRPAHEKRLHI